MSMLLTALYQSLLILPLLPILPVEPMNTQMNAELLPEFEGQIMSEPLKPGVGSDVMLSCPVKNLGKYKISWDSVDKQMLLVVQNVVIVDNPRINITKTSKGDISYWSLIITNASLSDSGYYICQIHTTPPKRLLKFLNIFVPLQFDKIQSMESNSVVRVRELQNVNLTCKATGNPKPTISWRKQDGQPLLVETNSNQIIESIESEVLHLREVSRSAIGYYVCIASNQISPSIRRNIYLEVEFPPTITVPNKMVSSYVDQNVTLECITESNPKAQHFWIDVFGNQIDSKNSYKYIVKTVDTNGFKVYFKLTIIDLDYRDAGKYVCLSNNRLGAIRSTISLNVYEIGVQTTTTTTFDELKTINSNDLNNTNEFEEKVYESMSPESHYDDIPNIRTSHTNSQNNLNNHFKQSFILNIVFIFCKLNFYY